MREFDTDCRDMAESEQRDSDSGENNGGVSGEGMSEAYRDTLPEIPMSEPPRSDETIAEQRPGWEPVPTPRATAHEVPEGVALVRSLSDR